MNQMKIYQNHLGIIKVLNLISLLCDTIFNNIISIGNIDMIQEELR